MPYLEQENRKRDTMLICKDSLKRCHSEAPVKLARVFFSARVGPRNLLRCS
jgi:hypothetical protein